MCSGHSDSTTNIAEAHCGEFDDTDENKLVYTELFESYTERIEAFLTAL